MTDLHKNPDIDMTEEYETLLAGPKEDNRPVLGWSLDTALKSQRPEVVEAVKANPKSFLVGVILASGFKDRGRGPVIIQHIAANHGLNFPRIFGAMPAKPSDERVPLPMPWGHFIPDCSPATKSTALANPVLHGTFDGQLYTIYFFDPNPEHPPFLILTYYRLSQITPELDILSALLAKLLSDPFVRDMANSDHSNVANETKPEVIFKVLLHFAKIRKYTPKRFGTVTPVFSIILPPLSTDPSQTAKLQQYLMAPDFSFDVPFGGTAIPWRNVKGDLMSCSECHSVAHYKDDCLILNSEAYKEHYGQQAGSDAAWYALNEERNSQSSSNGNGAYRSGPRGRSHGGYRGYNRGGGNPTYKDNGRTFSRGRGFPY